MSIINLLILLVIVGAALYLMSIVPIDEAIKQVIRVIVIAVVVIYAIIVLASLAGLSTGWPGGRLR